MSCVSFFLTHRYEQSARMGEIVIERHRYGARVLDGLGRYLATRVVVLLAVNGVDRCNHQAQPAALLDLPRGEGEALEIVFQRLMRRDELILTQALTIARAQPVT